MDIITSDPELASAETRTIGHYN